MSVKVYSKPGCPQCLATEKLMNKMGIDFEKVDISVDEQAQEMIISNYGPSVPVIVTENDSWVGFRPERIESIRELATV